MAIRQRHSQALSGTAAAVGTLVEPVELTLGTSAQHSRLLEDATTFAQHENAAFVLFATLDRFVRPLAIRAARTSPMPIPWIGILFHDSFNFPTDERRRVRALLKSYLRLKMLRLAMRGSDASLLTLNAAWRARLPISPTWLPDTLSSLDRMAQRAAATSNAWPLAQIPVKPRPSVRLLYFGIIHPRKGLLEFFDGLLRLSAAELSQIEIKAMGKVPKHGSSSYRDALRRVIAQLIARGATIQLTEEHVSEEVLDEALRWCDIVLAPYINHVGSSGVINIAAQYGRPVITQGTYQVGQEVRNNDLGMAIDTTSPEAVATAVRRILSAGLHATQGMAHYKDARRPDKTFEIACSAFAKFLNR